MRPGISIARWWRAERRICGLVASTSEAICGTEPAGESRMSHRVHLRRGPIAHAGYTSTGTARRARCSWPPAGPVPLLLFLFCSTYTCHNPGGGKDARDRMGQEGKRFIQNESHIDLNEPLTFLPHAISGIFS